MVRKGDDTNAFDFSFLTIELDNPEEYTISKAELRIGILIKTFKNPTFPLEVSLNREETMLLSECGNQCYLALYDMENRKYTCDETYTIKARPKVV